MPLPLLCRQSIEVLVDAEKASNVRRWEILEDFEVEFV